MKRFSTGAALCAALSFLAVPALASPSTAEIFRATVALRELGDLALSPDGSSVAWQQSFNDLQGANETRHRMALFIKRQGVEPQRFTAGDPAKYYDEENPVWSPDGKQLAFLSDARSPGQLQIFVADAAGANVRQVSSLKGNVQELRWLPNGDALSMLYIEDAHRSTGALAPGARDVGVIGSSVDEQRLATVDVASGHVQTITPAPDYVYEYDWSPNGKVAALTYAKGNGDNNWWIAKLATVSVTGGAMHDVLAPKFQINDPQWSPDGKRIAIVGGIMSDFGSVGGDVYLVDPSKRTAFDASAGMPASASSLHWVDDRHIYMAAHENGAMHLVDLDTASGSRHTVLGGEESLRSVSVAKNGKTIAVVRASFTRAPEIWSGEPNALAQITHVNAGAKALNGPAKSLNWTSGGYRVQGWLIYPFGYNPGKKYPMVTIVHGGPSAESLPGFGNRTIAALSSTGYFVFEPNPRGSFGQGETFTSANVKDFGYGDWRDDLAGVNAAIAAAPIDSHRLGLWGWSYGGYMGMWAETQTTRFKAIVAGAGIVNWQSYYGQNNIDQWMIPFFGASVYDDPAVYAKSSPITFIKASKTPVLILQGERDEEVPAPQAFEFWHAMKTLGVPAKLVVYADEGHSPRRPSNQIDILEQTLNWYSTYLR